MSKSTWVGGRFRSPFIIEKPVPFRPDLVLWLDASNNQLLVADVVEPDAPASVLVDHLKASLAQAAPPPPARIRVSDVAAANAIRPALMPGIAIEVGPTPELTAIVRLMEDRLAAEGSMAGDGRLAAYLQDGTVAAAAIASLFRECAALYKLAPWRALADADVLELDIPALGIEGACVSVLGAMKQNYGVLVFDSFDDFEEFGSRPPQLEEADEMDFGVSFLSLAFERGADLAPAMRREIVEQGWPVAGPKGHPVLWPVERDGSVRSRDARDVRIACAVVGGVAALVRGHGRGPGAPGSENVVVTVTVETPEPTEVTLKFPHAAVAYEQSAEPLSEEGLERAHEPAEDRIRSFLAAIELEGLPEDWREDAAFVCHCLYRFKVDYVDGRMEGLTAGHVEEFLLDHYPRKVSAREPMIQRTPEILERYFTWLGAAGLESAANVEQLRARLARARDEFLSVAGDPERFGMAKSFVMAMHDARVDFSDELAVAAYMKDFNRNIERRAMTRGSGARRREKAVVSDPPRPPAPRRWQPAADQPTPLAADPCPCGSGKRYKRCCMPR